MELKETSRRERAIVVGVLTDRGERAQAEEYLEELVLLADTAGAEVRHKITQERSGINPATFIGSGKAGEIGELVGEESIDLMIFDDDLSPVQVRNLEKIIKCKIVDRSGLILDIFASRARTKEAMTQVELAQLQYTLPRLTRQWTHLSKQYGGIGTKGPGEQQIEVDRRAIRKRIGMLQEKIERIDKERVVQRQKRGDFTRVALVGYTNAGKSTLFKLFSGRRGSRRGPFIRNARHDGAPRCPVAYKGDSPFRHGRFHQETAVPPDRLVQEHALGDD